MSDEKQEWAPAGKIIGVYGVKGWVKVYSDTHPKENIFSYMPWRLGMSEKDAQPVDVDHWKKQGKGLVAQLNGCDDRDKAVSLFVGKTLYIDKTKLPVLSADDYYWSDLIGLSVITVGGEKLGRVERLLETGANDVLEVLGDESSVDKKTRLLPYVPEEVIKQIDLDNKQMVVDWDPNF